MTEESGFGLTELVKLVVERSENLQTLYLGAVSLNAEHVSSMMEAIYLSKHTQLTKFGLNEMAMSVVANPDLFEMMLDFISRQEKLERFDCRGTLQYSADCTTRLLDTILQS